MKVLINIDSIDISNEIELLSPLILEAKLKAKRDAHEQDKMERLANLYADVSVNVLDKAKKANEIASETTASVKPIPVLYFDGEFYSLPEVAKKVNSGAEEKIYHNDGEMVQCIKGENKSDVFMVVRNENGKQVVQSTDGKLFNPSVITCVINERPVGTMAGLSHPSWKKVN